MQSQISGDRMLRMENCRVALFRVLFRVISLMYYQSIFSNTRIRCNTKTSHEITITYYTYVQISMKSAQTSAKTFSFVYSNNSIIMYCVYYMPSRKNTLTDLEKKIDYNYFYLLLFYIHDKIKENRSQKLIIYTRISVLHNVI